MSKAQVLLKENELGEIPQNFKSWVSMFVILRWGTCIYYFENEKLVFARGGMLGVK